ncbi:MAG: translation initiation inhibitor [Planctomycetes bacterium]|nr:translation initiation inhibitor [Planctomycetota bacterium]
MEFLRFDANDFPATVDIARFCGPRGVTEANLVVSPKEYGSIEDQLGCVLRGYGRALRALGMNMRTAVWRRFFCSDFVNQAPGLKARVNAGLNDPDDACALSCVGQAPIPPAKVALWAYHISDPEGRLDKSRDGQSLRLRRHELSHLWTTGLTCPSASSSQDQTRGIFEEYDAYLRAQNLSLSDHVLRTWVFVRDIDADYSGMVAARREFFAQRGLTPETHYIASSGIAGQCGDVAARVALDAYAIAGVQPEQIEYIEALDHLCPTHAYGVTFERATAVAYRDRKHILISGTASIDHEGHIVHPGDVGRQLEHTLANIAALLARAGATLADMGMFVVYIRDTSDGAVVRQRMRARLGDAPLAFVAAPVCRPGWLIEIEGQAIIPSSNPGLPAF